MCVGGGYGGVLFMLDEVNLDEWNTVVNGGDLVAVLVRVGRWPWNGGRRWW